MATFVKQITKDQKLIVKEENISSVFTMAYGSELKFTYLDSVNNVGFKNNKYNSLWSMFNLNSEQIFDSYNVDYSDGGLKNTVWESILEAYSTNGMIMFEVSDQNWRKSIDGQNIELKIPLSGGTFTGTTSASTLYSAFIDTPSLKEKSTRSVCDPVLLDLAIAEANKVFTNDIGIGYKYQVGANPLTLVGGTNVNTEEKRSQLYNSGMVLLVSNDWMPWSGSSSAKTWSSEREVVLSSVLKLSTDSASTISLCPDKSCSALILKQIKNNKIFIIDLTILYIKKYSEIIINYVLHFLKNQSNASNIIVYVYENHNNFILIL